MSAEGHRIGHGDTLPSISASAALPIRRGGLLDGEIDHVRRAQVPPAVEEDVGRGAHDVLGRRLVHELVVEVEPLAVERRRKGLDAVGAAGARAREGRVVPAVQRAEVVGHGVEVVDRTALGHGERRVVVLLGDALARAVAAAAARRTVAVAVDALDLEVAGVRHHGVGRHVVVVRVQRLLRHPLRDVEAVEREADERVELLAPRVRALEALELQDEDLRQAPDRGLHDSLGVGLAVRAVDGLFALELLLARELIEALAEAHALAALLDEGLGLLHAGVHERVQPRAVVVVVVVPVQREAHGGREQVVHGAVPEHRVLVHHAAAALDARVGMRRRVPAL
mmetsp:Transcript_21630/g.66190  ORF Transcript_21630/g.66190 Transcript_21630/m.66190 type:complete len:339 (+) Transcript_21630:555-1571(+)